ncbi:uncharacterized protein L203_102060 [Cryptococcus depauperatus CBS 7841]|uniref:Uncharacterized protein n=1 Tax=Cryptococcus depauperatus CBS 7841 TaxID=1295531 RepID=A0AAJ8JR54_9TREE
MPEADTGNKNSTEKAYSEWYLRHLDSHILTSRRSLSGHIQNTLQSFQSTYVYPTNAFWNSHEKSAFFAALARHSRYRPDLIALDIGKSESEVVWYFDLLESARIHQDQEPRRRNRKTELKRSHRFQEGLAPAAREVSASWLKVEEGLANGVAEYIENTSYDNKKRLQKKRKRKEKNDLITRFEDLEGKKGNEKKRALEGRPEIEELEQQWAVQDWLETIGEERFEELDRLLQNVWLDEYQKCLTHSASFFAAVHLEEEGTLELTETRAKGDPTGKIARDLQLISVISSIPKKQRTMEQRQLLAKVVNRQRCREQYRTKKLRQEGMTKEEIAESGGADAVFAMRNGTEISTTLSSTMLKKTLGSTYTKVGEKMVYEFAKEHGIDLFNYKTMQRLMKTQGDTTTTSVSLMIIQELYNELMIYLKPLIYNIIIFAEQFLAQTYHSKDKETENNQHFNAVIAPEHVYWALAVSDNLHRMPFDEDMTARTNEEPLIAAGKKADDKVFNGESEKQSDDTDVNTALSMNHSALSDDYRLAPDNLPWTFLPFTSKSLLADHCASLSSDNDNSALSDTYHDTDQEDEALDAAQDEVDIQHDRIYEQELQKALEAENEDYEPDDFGNEWWERSEKSAVERDYITLHVKISNSRQKRRKAARLSTNKDTKKLRSKALSKKFIDESEQDDVEDLVGGAPGNDECQSAIHHTAESHRPT